MMKLRTTVANLRAGLFYVSKSVATHSTLPVLNNILLATDDGRLKLSATNLEMTSICHVEADITSEGAITVPAKIFGDLVKTLPSDALITLTLDEATHTLMVENGEQTSAQIRGIPATEFPNSIASHTSIRFEATVEAKRFLTLIHRVIFAAALGETRPILTGVSMVFNGTCQAACTDGFRLSVCETAVLASQGEADMVVPARGLKELQRIVKDEAHIKIRVKDSQVVFHLEEAGVTLIVQLIVGQYPTYHPILQETQANTQTTITVDTRALKVACTRATIFAREAANSTRLTIHHNDDGRPHRLTLSAMATEMGANDEQLLIVEGKGPEQAVSFNVAYLREALNAVGNAPQVVLQLADEEAPCLLTIVDDTSFQHVLMPMHDGKPNP